MARCPFAQWRPLGADVTHQPLMAKHDGIVLHTMVGTLEGTDSYFRQQGYVGVESHFGVGWDGTIYQWTDTARTADANLDGNARLLSIETADMGEGFGSWSGSDVPAWRPEQVAAIARIVAWAADTHDFPIVRMPDSRPSRRGVGYHRLGIDPWRVTGGESWSTSTGKVCPGDRRIAQVDDVIRLARGDTWPAFRSTSPAVGDMVTRLSLAGYFGGKRRDKPDYYGAFTRAAIRALQEAQGWSGAAADGLLGPQTWALIQALPDAPPPHRSPLADDWLATTHAASMAGAAFITAHPHMPAYAALHAQQRAEAAAIRKLAD